MNILYVDLLYDYGIKARGLNNIGQDGFLKSFERLGHVVCPFYYDNYLNDTPSLQNALCQKADAVKPDLIFFSLFKDQFTPKTLKYLSKKYLTINWFGDDQWRFDGFTSIYAPLFSFCVTTDKFSIEKYHALGQKNVIYSQWAAINEHTTAITQAEYRYGVSFVGAFHPYRKWFIDQLIKSGISTAVFGNGWPTGGISSDEMNSVFRDSKINLNISNSSSFDIRYLISSPRALIQSLRSQKTNSQIKARNFEIPYFGGFQMTDYVPTIEEYLSIGTEVICYSSVDEAAQLIRYYLQNDVEREKVKLAGQQRAILEHGYFQRLEKVFEEIK